HRPGPRACLYSLETSHLSRRTTGKNDVLGQIEEGLGPHGHVRSNVGTGPNCDRTGCAGPDRDAVRATKMKNVPATPFGDTEDLDRLTRLIALANSQDARVVGITGYETGVGVSWTSRQLAAAYARFGRRVLLVDASGAVDASAGRNGFEGAA